MALIELAALSVPSVVPAPSEVPMRQAAVAPAMPTSTDGFGPASQSASSPVASPTSVERGQLLQALDRLEGTQKLTPAQRSQLQRTVGRLSRAQTELLNAQVQYFGAMEAEVQARGLTVRMAAEHHVLNGLAQGNPDAMPVASTYTVQVDASRVTPRPIQVEGPERVEGVRFSCIEPGYQLPAQTAWRYRLTTPEGIKAEVLTPDTPGRDTVARWAISAYASTPPAVQKQVNRLEAFSKAPYGSGYVGWNAGRGTLGMVYEDAGAATPQTATDAVATIIHESGHNLQEATPSLSSAQYITIARSDPRSPSLYALDGLADEPPRESEDFAEAWTDYNMQTSPEEKARLRAAMPGRFALFDRLTRDPLAQQVAGPRSALTP